MSTYARFAETFARGPFSERIALFSDAVFAIAMTLLVIELHAPEVPDAALPEALLELVRPYLTFALSFAVIAMVWLSHFRKLRAVAHFDATMLRLNLLMLFFVASLPLPTAILGQYGDTVVAAVIYAATICAIGFTMTALWAYVWRAGLVGETVDAALFRFVVVQSLPVPVVFLLSIPVALVCGATAAELTWILALPASLAITLILRRAPEAPKEARA